MVWKVDVDEWGVVAKTLRQHLERGCDIFIGEQDNINIARRCHVKT